MPWRVLPDKRRRSGTPRRSEEHRARVNVACVNRPLAWPAVAYVALLFLGRSSLPLNAQWGDLLFPVLLAGVWWSAPRKRWWSRNDWPLALYLTVTLGATLVSAGPLTGLQQFLKVAYVAAIFLVFRVMAADEALTRRLSRTLVVVTAAVAAAAIVVVFLRFPSSMPLSVLGAKDVLPFFGAVRRIRGVLLTPEMFGGTLVVAFALALGLRSLAQGRARMLWTAAAALLFVAEILTVSHSVAGFAVTAVLAGAGGIPSRGLRAVAWSAAFGVLVVVNAASVVDLGGKPNDYGVAPVTIDIAGTRLEGRLSHYFALKQVAWSTFVQHPLTGVGPGRFPLETERAFQEGRLPERYRDKPPQCDPAGRLAEAGLPGFLSLVVLWTTWLHGIRERSRRAPALQRTAGAAVVGLLVNSLNADVMNYRFLWVALAWALAPETENE